MGGKTRSTSESRQTTSLPEGQQTNVDSLMQGIQQLMQSGGPQYFQGQNYTTPTANQVAGRQGAVNYATGPGQQMVNQAQQANQFWMDPSRVWDLESVPGYTGVKSGIVDTATQNLTQNILPAYHLGGVAGGNLGGSRGAMADSLAMGETGGQIGRAIAGLDLGVGQMNMGANQAAISRAPQMFQLGMAPSNVQMEVGSQQRYDQAEQIQGDKERWDANQMQFPKLLAMVQALTGSAGQYGGTVDTTQTQSQSGGGASGIMQGVGGALALASLFMPALAPVAAGVGALGAATGGASGGITPMPTGGGFQQQSQAGFNNTLAPWLQYGANPFLPPTQTQQFAGQPY